jgi:enoyl-CoA hydratase/carnithine racemase
MSFVHVERDGAVAVVRLDRDEKLNAISTAVERELHEALVSDEVRSSRAVAVEGAGRAFSAGADITEFAERDAAAALQYYRDTGGVYEEFAALPQPTVVALHGWCLGAGLELALAADFRVADDTAVLGFPEIGIGILPSSGGTLRATRLLGQAGAKRLILLGERLAAAEALQAGLVTEVAPNADVRACELAHRLAGLPATAVAVTKALIDNLPEASRESATLIERLAYAVLAQTAEAREAAEGFR